MIRRSARTLIALALATVTLPAVAGVAGADVADDAKVTHSVPAAPGDFPAQVALLNAAVDDPYQAQFCGGTHLLADWVLTAAHCLDNGGFIDLPDVLLGTERLDGSGERIATVEAIVHPQWDDATFDNDIALLRLARPAAGALVDLVYPGQELVVFHGAPAAVTGWGGLYTDEENQDYPVDLQVGEVSLVGDAECDTRLGEYGLYLSTPESQVCAGDGVAGGPEEVDACRGDSGGPLWLEPGTGRRQIGIVSFGPTCGLSPTVYSDVTPFIGFLEGATGRQLASFPDIPGTTHERSIETVAVVGITGGQSNGTFAPSGAVTRGQMATFIARSLALEPVAGGPFTDVAGTTHEGNINAVAAAGIAGGFADGTYRPNEPVSRGQMATFLARALDLEAVATGPFTDVAGTTHEGNINAVAAAGIAGGYADGTYRPGTFVNRGQMATFLVRGFLTP